MSHSRFFLVWPCVLKLVLLFIHVSPLSASAAGAAGSISPLQRVVKMLQKMAKQVEEEAKREADLYDKFMCFCETRSKQLNALLAEGRDREPQLATNIEENKAVTSQLEQELEAHKQDLSTAQTAIDEAKAMRKQESDAFEKDSTEQRANIEAVGLAVEKLEQGIGRTEFLQSDPATFLEGLLVEGGKLSRSSNGEMLSAFLHQGAQAPATTEVIGMLKQMGEDMQSDLDSMEKEESEAKATFDALKLAKEKEISAATKAIETKGLRLSDAKVQLVDLQNDLEDTEQAIAKNEKMLASIGTSCSARKEEYVTMKKEIAAERIAIADTIKMLNSADVEALFKKTLPGLSFLQLGKLQAIHAHNIAAPTEQHVGPVSFLAMKKTSSKRGTSTGKLRSNQEPGNFEKIVALFDKMIALLVKDQKDDDMKKERCTHDIQRESENKLTTEQDIKSKTADVDTLEDQLAVQDEEIETLKKRIVGLDKAVAEATAIRKDGNSDYQTLMAQNTAAVEVLEKAKVRLEKFYNPRLYKATDAFTQLVGTGKESADAAGKSRKPQTEAGRGVIEMISLIQDDIRKESDDAKKAELKDQEDFEDLVQRSTQKREVDTKTLTEKGAVKAEMRESLKILQDSKKELESELASIIQVLKNLHEDCDWFLQNAELRKTARSTESEALKKAKAVINGADYS